ncbi:MAG: acetylxylan esterase [Victivallaceae bacterium]|nr:acetylxylan esterase [Victivallaceae bacterium]
MKSGLMIMTALCGITAAGAITLAPDRTNALYEIGDTAAIELKCDRPVTVSISGDYANFADFTMPQGEHKFTVPCKVPGFVMIKADDGTNSASCGVGISPKKILPYVDEPADFDEFWKNAIAEAAAIPLDPQLENLPEHSTGQYTAYRVSFANVGNTRIYGFLTIPNGDGPYPIYCAVPGAGPNDLKPLDKHNERVITLVMNVFPFPLPPDRAEAERLIAGHYPESRGYWSLNSAKLEYFFFYRAILGINRAFDYAAALPQADRKHMVYWGSSQGGAMGVALAALNRNLTAMVLNVPSDYSKIIERAHREGDDSLMSRLPYFAGANFAKRITIPFMTSAGMVDVGCTPFSVAKFYNRITGEKRIRYVPTMGHSFDPEYERMTAEFIDRQLEK